MWEEEGRRLAFGVEERRGRKPFVYSSLAPPPPPPPPPSATGN